jgi:hypothetical protein
MAMAGERSSTCQKASVPPSRSRLCMRASLQPTLVVMSRALDVSITYIGTATKPRQLRQVRQGVTAGC